MPVAVHSVGTLCRRTLLLLGKANVHAVKGARLSAQAAIGRPRPRSITVGCNVLIKIYNVVKVITIGMLLTRVASIHHVPQHVEKDGLMRWRCKNAIIN